MPPGAARKGVGVPPHDMSARPEGRVGSEAVVMLTHSGPTALDLVGPQRMLAFMAGAAVQVVARIRELIRSDTGLTIVLDASFEEAPQAPDILFGPGAVSGTLTAMEDAPTVDVVPRGQAARDITSACTGALILGRAGLQGPGARPRTGPPRPAWRFSTPRPWMGTRCATAASSPAAGPRRGSTSASCSWLSCADRARAVQPLAEHTPSPPFDAGTLATTPAETSAMMRAMVAGLGQHVEAAAELGRQW